MPAPVQAAPPNSPPKAPRKVGAHKKSYSTGSSSATSAFDIQKLLAGDSPTDASNSREDTASRSSESVKSLDVIATAATKEKKKRRSLSWYNVLSPSYKSRTEDFKRIFKDLPDSERLIVDYSCAIQKDILIHGRLYISQNFISFYANIFRWETLLTIRCRDVTSISKEKTALVIPNAIQIGTASSERHFFTSFGAREKTYMMLFRVWQNALMEQPMAPQELWQWIHLSYGDDLGLTSDDDDYISPTANGDKKHDDGVTKQLSESLGSNCHNQSLEDSSSAGTNSAPTPTTPSSPSSPRESAVMDGVTPMDDEIPEEAEEADDADDPSSSKVTVGGFAKVCLARTNSAVAPARTSPKVAGARSRDEASADATSESEKEDVDIGGDAEVRCPCEAHDGRELVNVVVGLPVDRAFEFIFSNSKFMRDFHASRKTTDVVHGSWRTSGEVKTRKLTFTIHVNLGLTVKTAQTIETQNLVTGSRAGHAYTVSVDAITPGLPYGDAFYTHHTYCLTRVSPGECRLRIHSQIKYKKSVWGVIKSFIERNAWSGLTEFFKQFEESFIKAVVTSKIPARPAQLRDTRVGGDTAKVIASEILAVDDDEEEEEEEEDDEEDGDKQFLLTRQWNLPPNAVHKDAVRANSTSTDILVPIILLVLVSLLVLNAMLYYRLWAMEAGDDGHSVSGYTLGCSIDPELLKKPKSNEDWMKLLREQDGLHRTEVSKWREIIDTVVALLQETETSLINLKHNIQAYSQGGKTNVK